MASHLACLRTRRALYIKSQAYFTCPLREPSFHRQQNLRPSPYQPARKTSTCVSLPKKSEVY